MPIRRAAPPAPVGVNFGDDSFYTGGFNLPEGDYALAFDARMHAFTKQNGTRGVESLGVMVTAYPLLEDKGEITFGEPMEQFYRMGQKAHLSFAPKPETGKGIVPIPGGPSGNLSRLTNWDVLRKSLYDCGLPPGTFTNDLSVLDGVWVHMRSVAAPEERKSFGAKTGEAQEEERASVISVVTEILEVGAPWKDGGGGLPDGAGEIAPPPPPKPAARTLGRKPAATAAASPAVRKLGPKPAAVAAATEAEGDVSEEDIMAAAVAGATTVLEKLKEGESITKLLLRTGLFKAVTAQAGEEMCQAVMETFLVSDAKLNSVLGQLGYKVQGTQIVPA